MTTVNIILAAKTWADTGFPHTKAGLRKAQASVHPDRCSEAGATDAFMRLDDLFNAPDVRLRFVSGRFQGGYLSWELDDSYKDLLNVAREAQEAVLQYPSKADWVPVPKIVNGALESHYGPGWYLLNGFDKFDARTTAWIWRRFMAAITVAEEAGWVHGDLNENTVAIMPKEHGLRIDGWWTAVRVGEPLAVAPDARTLSQFLNGNEVDSRMSVAQISELLLRIGTPSPKLATLLKKFRFSPESAKSAFVLGDEAIKRDFGPSQWHELEIPKNLPEI